MEYLNELMILDVNGLLNVRANKLLHGIKISASERWNVLNVAFK
jgi:hypothetical protein